jgi:hypothetical protein
MALRGRSATALAGQEYVVRTEAGHTPFGIDVVIGAVALAVAIAAAAVVFGSGEVPTLVVVAGEVAGRVWSRPGSAFCCLTGSW